eukprot:357902_1
MGSIGSCVKKLGSENQGRIMLCLPIALAEIGFGVFFSARTGYEIYDAVRYFEDPKLDWHDWAVWMRLIFSSLIAFGNAMAAIAMLVIGCLNNAFLAGWAIRGTTFIGVLSIISY